MKGYNFARGLKAALLEANKTQAALAAHLGMTRGAISHWLKGRNGAPDPEVIEKIAAFLGIDPGKLLFGQGAGGPQNKPPTPKRGSSKPGPTPAKKPSGMHTAVTKPARARPKALAPTGT